ncbi:MAG: DUF3999 domain-containing protein [Burkholderiales bacterium]|nr:DUF3999 domain-containing protein [Burkholderiales bacterium]
MKLAVLAVALVAVTAHAEEPSDYAFGVPVAAAAGATYLRVALPPAVYEGVVSRDLADLRVFNAAGEVVPFALVPQASPARERPPPIALPMFPLYADRDRPGVEGINLTVVRNAAGTIVSFDASDAGNAPGRTLVGYVLDASAQDEPLVSLTFALPDRSNASSMRMRIDAGDDLAAWRTVDRDATLVNLVHDGQRLTRDRVDFAPTKAKYLRLSWTPGRPVIEFTAVTGERGERMVEPPREWRAVAGTPVKDRPGDYEYDLGGAFPVDRIAVDLTVPNSIVPVSVFARRAPAEAWLTMGTTVFYRLAQPDGGDVASAPFAVTGDGRRYWLIRVDSRAGVAGGTMPARFGWRPQEIVFAARGAGPFTLAFGRFDATRGALPIETLVPDYARAGMASLANVALAQAGSRVVLGGPERAQKAADVMRWALWAALVAGVLVLGWMAWRLVRDMSAKPGD